MGKEDQGKKIPFNEQPFWIWWKKYGDHLTAPLILIGIIILAHGQYESIGLQKEVSQNCGWGEEDYECYCAKSEALKIKNLMENPNSLMNFTYDIEGAGIDKAQKEARDYFFNPNFSLIDNSLNGFPENNS